MDFYLVFRCPQKCSPKHLERDFERLIQITEFLCSMRDNIKEEMTKELMWGRAPTLQCKKWLEKAGEIESEVNELVVEKEKSSDHLMRSRMNLYGQLMSVLKEITDHLEEYPHGHGSISSIRHGEAHGLVQTNKNVNFQRSAKTKGVANVEIGMSSTHGKEAVQGKEMQQGKYLKSALTPSRATSIEMGESIIGEAHKGNVTSQNEGGQRKPKLTKDLKKSSEPTINLAEVEIPFQKEAGKAPLEQGVNANRSIERILHEIMGCMNDITTSKIAIHGIGGIGKTSVLKALINHVERKDMFDVIISVTVTKHWSTRKIQNEVLRQLSLPDSETDSKAAEKLVQVLGSMKFLLLLDDVWERVDLTAVGIPDIKSGNGCRMILATRILDVCNEMASNRVIEMETVCREEAWELFHEQVGALVDSPGIQPYARAIVEECGGLPLLIIVTGRALTGVNDALVWKRALRELLLPSMLGTSGFEAVMQRLKFSYDRLRARDIKSCFLYCALFSEDQEVNVSELVKCYIQEGLISGNCDDACKRGHEIVDILICASLLQSTKGGLAIKMHAVVRDLALIIILSKAERFQFLSRHYNSILTETENSGISSMYRPLESPESNRLPIPEGCQFLLRAGAGLREPPLKEEWEQAKIIALMDNELSNVPENPSCPNLLMLFLERNKRLRVIPTSFFGRMPSLEVLNLSNTKIKFLPQSILKLKRLKILILRNCERLGLLPSEVGSLGDLEVLDLGGTEVNNLPDEISSLASLRHLEVSFYGPNSPSEYAKLPHELLSHGILSKLSSLETLSIDVYPGDQRWKKSVGSITVEVCSLKKLTALFFCFPEVEHLEIFRNCPTWNRQLLTKFKIVVGHDVKRIMSRVPDYVLLDYNQQGRCLRFVNGDGEKVPDAVVDVLARTFAFYLDHHLSILNLSKFGVDNLGRLKLCIVSECPTIESIIDGKGLTKTVFPSLEQLSIHYLWNLKTIWKGIIPNGSFAKLRILLVHACPKLKFVFTRSMISYLYNLEELVVEDCPAIEEITQQVEIMDSENGLSSLKRLTLNHLPGLVNISEGAWCSLEYISLYNCPNWKTITMHSEVKVHCKED